MKFFTLRGNGIKAEMGNDTSEVDITPMLDVVFILLIFFIVTASFVKESSLDILTPPDVSTMPADNPPIVLEINAQNQIFIESRQLDVRAIRPTITRLKAERPAAEVAIKVSPQAKTKTIVSAIDSVRAAKIMQPILSLASR